MLSSAHFCSELFEKITAGAFSDPLATGWSQKMRETRRNESIFRPIGYRLVEENA
ncbi:MAG: hypothetical protein ACK5TM_11240 [Methylobacterium sp.]